MSKPMFFFNPMPQFFDNSGLVLNGGLLYFYAPGTTTLINTYPTSADALAGTNANSNPLVLDSAGRLQADIYVNQTFKCVLKTSAGVTIKTEDNITTLGQLIATLSKTGNYTVTVSDRDKLIQVDATSGSNTQTLMAAATAGDGFVIKIKKTDSTSNTVTIQANGAELIDGANTFILYNQYETVSLVCDGTQWLLQNSMNVTKAGYQQFLGVGSVFKIVTGTWTLTRNAQANYSYAHSVADETSILAIDITNSINTTTSKGFKLTSFDVIYAIATGALDAHTITLDKVNYVNNASIAITSVPLTGSLATAVQANVYVTNIAVTTPAFNNTTASKYVVELTVNNSASSVYNFYGLNLHFSKND